MDVGQVDDARCEPEPVVVLPERRQRYREDGKGKVEQSRPSRGREGSPRNHARLVNSCSMSLHQQPMRRSYGQVGRRVISDHFLNLAKWKFLDIETSRIHPLSFSEFILHVMIPEA